MSDMGVFSSYPSPCAQVLTISFGRGLSRFTPGYGGECASDIPINMYCYLMFDLDPNWPFL